jgi:hypothetical protein
MIELKLGKQRQRLFRVVCSRLRLTKFHTMVQNLKKRISNDPASPWWNEYWDLHRQQVIVKVDAHQLSSRFTKSERYDNIMPNTCIASMNQHADNAASYALGTLTRYGPTQKNPFPTPTNQMHPLGLRFEVALGETTLDRDSSCSIYKDVEQELSYRLATVSKQGVWVPWCVRSQRFIPDYGMVRQIIQGKGHSFTQTMYKSATIRQRHTQWVHDSETTDLVSDSFVVAAAKAAPKIEMLQCCFYPGSHFEDPEGRSEFDFSKGLNRTSHNSRRRLIDDASI